MQAPNIHDVARVAGVATSTVSRALAGRPRVSEATRRRVVQVAADLGYHPSRSARALRSARTQTLGLVFPSLENPIAITQLSATIKAAFALGYTVFVTDAQDSPEILEAELARMLEYRVDGIILGRGRFPGHRGLLQMTRAGIPVEPELELEPAQGVEPDADGPFNAYADRGELDRVAAMAAYRLFLRLGHRRFAYVDRGSGRTGMGEARLRGLVDALRECGLGPGAISRVTILDPGDCVAEIQRLAALPERPTALICANGLLTPHVAQGIVSSGLRIPDDMSVLAFGDSAWHQGYSPPLSVVRHDYTAAAFRGVQRLIARIRGDEVPEIPLKPSEFVPRASIGPVPVRPTEVAPSVASRRLDPTKERAQ